MGTRIIEGTIRVLHSDKGFGFIAASDGKEYFFHRSAATAFADLQPGDVVHFVPGDAPKGPRAESVERA